MPTLTIQYPGLPPVAHVLREETTTIGRMKGSTIVVDDTSVSLMHAKITRSKEGEYFLKDLNSTNGTLLNGQTVREAKLQNLDQICFADIIAQFHADAVAPVQPITPLKPAPTLIASAPTAPTTPGAATAAPAPLVPPMRASQAIATTDAAKHRRSSHPNSKFDLTKLADRAVPILGGLAAVVVVSIVVWKLFLSKPHGDVAESNQPTPAEKAKPSQPSGAQAKADGKSSAPAPNKTAPQEPAPPKSDNANISRLVIGLKDADVEERRRAARGLHTIGAEAKEALAPLRQALKDSDEEVQMWAALTLVNNKSYDKPVIPILVRSLRHENSTLRQVVCLSLAIYPYETAEKEIVVGPLAAAAANDDDEEVRKSAYSALTIIAPEIVAKANEKNQ